MANGLLRKWRQSSKASPVPRFLQSNGDLERHISDSRILISASPALKETTRNKIESLDQVVATLGAVAEHPRFAVMGQALFQASRWLHVNQRATNSSRRQVAVVPVRQPSAPL